MSCYFASLRRAALEVAPQPCLQSGFCPPLEGDRSAGPGGGQGARSASAAHGGGVDRELSAPGIAREEKTTAHTPDQPDQSAQSIRLNIKSQKRRRWNLPFTTRGQYLRASSAETVYPRVHQTLAKSAARRAPRLARERSKTIPSPRDQRFEF
jgi:hypothetical protein